MKEIIDHIEQGINLPSLEHHKRGDSVYTNGRQVLVRACNDAIVGYYNDKNEKGAILIRRKAEPAKDYLWCLGGGIEKGIPTLLSLAKKIKAESNLDISNPVLLTVERLIWGNTPNTLAKSKDLPLGIDDLCVLYYCEGNGRLNLDQLHEAPLIVTPKMYTQNFRKKLHPYIQKGMDLAMSYIKD